jgi:hypothetical protein
VGLVKNGESGLNEQDMLTRLRSAIEPSLVPVKPLDRPAARATTLLAVFVVLVVGVPAVFGPRPDIELPALWEYVKFSILQAACAYVLVVVSLRFSMPAWPKSPSTALAWIAVGLCIHVFVAWIAQERSAGSPTGHEWRTGLACLGAITLLSLVPLALGTIMLLRGLVTHRLLAFALMGLSGALGAESAWRLHCDYSAWDHVLPAHSGALVLVTFVALSAAVALGPGGHQRQ